MEDTTSNQDTETESLSDILERMSDRVFSSEETTESTELANQQPQADASTAITDYTRVETSLETIGYFQAGYKRSYPKPKEKRQVQLTKGRVIEYYPNATFGYPNTEDEDFFRGFNKIVANRATMVERWNEKTMTYDFHPQIKSPIAFTTAELLRASGKGKSKQNVQELRDFIKRQTAHVMSGKLWSAKRKKFEEFTGSLFSMAYLRGEHMKGGEVAESHVVWLSPLFLSNFYYYYTKQIDLAYYRSLQKPISKGLRSLLESGWHAAIKNHGFYWEKSYRDICHRLKITPRSHLSRIKEQLDPAHRELSDDKQKRDDYRFLESWEYRQSAKSKGDFIIRYYPGAKFFADQRERQRSHQKASNILNGRQKLDLDKQLLLSEVVSFCGDDENTPAYLKSIQENSVTKIERVLAETRLAQREGRIKKSKGAYFMDTLKIFSS